MCFVHERFNAAETKLSRYGDKPEEQKLHEEDFLLILVVSDGYTPSLGYNTARIYITCEASSTRYYSLGEPGLHRV